MRKIIGKIVRKMFYLMRLPRHMLLSVRYGISPRHYATFGKRVRVVNPRYIVWGGKSTSTMTWNCA